MKKDYEVFVEELRQALLAATGYEKSRIYFKKGEEYPQTVGDRIFVECSAGAYSREVCGLYAQDLYQYYLGGTSLNVIIQRTIEDLNRMKTSGILETAQYLDDYEKIKQNLFIRLLNMDKNQKELKNSVFRVIGDIAMVLYVRMGKFENVISSFKVKKEMVDHWHKNQGEVFEEALKNTYYITPPRIFQWEKLVFDPDYRGDNFMDTPTDFPLKKDAAGNCLSTDERTNGAVAVFLPGVARRISDLMGSGFYMVFTSIHEVMIHNDKMVEVEKLRRVLIDTLKEATPEDEFLTLNIYHYDRETGSFSWQ